ncbi:unnamed protein product [Withania somnifera]
MPVPVVNEEEIHQKLAKKIARVFNDVQSSQATHLRKLKELSTLRSSTNSSKIFFHAFTRVLMPIFDFQRRSASAERIVTFLAVFASVRDAKRGEDCDEFLEKFMRFLLVAAIAGSKTARIRAFQIISEIIIRLPDETEVSSELWDEVLESTKLRVGDKVAAVRTFAVRALLRFVNDTENVDILELFLETLPLEQNADVRRTIVLCLPPSHASSAAIIDIKLRTLILERGLADRASSVVRECFRMLKDEWLTKCCNGDPLELLKYLDVETYESVGESATDSLLKAGLIKLQDGQSMRQFLRSNNDEVEGQCKLSVQLMEAEVAFFWRAVCKHLQMEAQAKGSEAATTMDTVSAVYAAEASDKNDLLDRVLPASIGDYVELVKAHTVAGINYRFASRQLLLLGVMLDFSDVTNRRHGNEVIIGDGINLGGDKDWAAAVAELTRKVHSAPGEFVEVVLQVVEELARSCRERTADFMQWLHSIEPTEVLHSVLLPGAKHVHLDVQRAAIRCLGLFGLLERRPSEDLVKQLRSSFAKGPSSITAMASKAMIDLGLWHGPNVVDKAMNRDLSSQLQDHKIKFSDIKISIGSEDVEIELLDLLYTGLEKHNLGDSDDCDEHETVQTVLGEGFAKILLLSKKYPSIPTLSNPLLLAKLISLCFYSENKELERNVYMPVMRSLWPGINGNATGSSFMISNMQKRATQASRFMVQMMQAPLYYEETAPANENDNESHIDSAELSSMHESGEEGLAIRIAGEVVSFHAKKTAAEKAYVSALCKTLFLLHFRQTEQGAIKLMRELLSRVTLLAERELLKELKQMAERLKGLDKSPDQKLSSDEAKLILGKLDLDIILDEDEPMEVLLTPAPKSTRTIRTRRRVKEAEESSSDEELTQSVVPTRPVVTGSRSQRASKIAALSKMTVKTTTKIDEYDDEEDEEEEADSQSEVTSMIIRCMFNVVRILQKCQLVRDGSFKRSAFFEDPVCVEATLLESPRTYGILKHIPFIRALHLHIWLNTFLYYEVYL